MIALSNVSKTFDGKRKVAALCGVSLEIGRGEMVSDYTIDTNRSLAAETAVRQNGDGMWLKFEYSQALSPHRRLTADLAIIRDSPSDFLGQYRRNTHGLLTVRYSF